MNEAMKAVGLTSLTDSPMQENFTGIYIGDLLSLVMAKAKKGNIWLTVQTHLNVIAIATLLELACVIIVEGQIVEEAVISKAKEEGVILLSSDLSAYELALKLTNL
jgi:hypothetical protein